MPRGEDLGPAWSEMVGEERADVAEQLGFALADLHQRTINGLQRDGWAGFVPRRRKELLQRHRAGGVPPVWSRQFEPFLDGIEHDDPDRLLPLHTKLSFPTVQIRHRPGGWLLSGVSDFECAMLGPREFDIAWTALSVARGKRRFVRSLLDGAQVEYEHHDLELQRRLLQMVLLHPDLDLARWMRRLGVPRTATLDALARHWFPM
ncbi:aminoglycoside phosphotransferase family protein [Allokutzneria sp. A3M-2-11 16]|uniref:phosphotransferase n=1 Tax=Allokutzneria sp. A3M-2-11 16 TaxID=2962043 RepID=UPI0020B68757|nr:phosphotransferase [Allokutzneria sp. A3M-2-11 16]MCP3802878.1 aminoglycoside phosphotransferase family protein [Allokutzneria sp. A3M-2-11 16]